MHLNVLFYSPDADAFAPSEKSEFRLQIAVEGEHRSPPDAIKIYDGPLCGEK